MQQPKVAVVGCGYWGRNLVRNFQNLGALRVVCELTQEGRRAAREIASDVLIFGEYEQVLNSNVDGVVIATPADTHYELASRALDAGKDVLVEKPLALAAEHAQALVGLASSRNRILMVGHVLEYHPALAELKSVVERGCLGEVRYLYSNRLSLGKVRLVEDVVWSFAPHDISVLLRLAGCLPSRVAATGSSYLSPGIADTAVINLDFGMEKQGHAFVSWVHPYKEQRIVVIGSERMASYDDVDKRLVIYNHRFDTAGGPPMPIKGDSREVSFRSEEPLRAECQAFLHAVAARERPVADGESAVRVIKVLEAVSASLAEGGRVTDVQGTETRKS